MLQNETAVFGRSLFGQKSLCARLTLDEDGKRVQIEIAAIFDDKVISY